MTGLDWTGLKCTVVHYNTNHFTMQYYTALFNSTLHYTILNIQYFRFYYRLPQCSLLKSECLCLLSSAIRTASYFNLISSKEGFIQCHTWYKIWHESTNIILFYFSQYLTLYLPVDFSFSICQLTPIDFVYITL